VCPIVAARLEQRSYVRRETLTRRRRRRCGSYEIRLAKHPFCVLAVRERWLERHRTAVFVVRNRQVAFTVKCEPKRLAETVLGSVASGSDEVRLAEYPCCELAGRERRRERQHPVVK